MQVHGQQKEFSGILRILFYNAFSGHIVFTPMGFFFFFAYILFSDFVFLLISSLSLTFSLSFCVFVCMHFLYIFFASFFY